MRAAAPAATTSMFGVPYFRDFRRLTARPARLTARPARLTARPGACEALAEWGAGLP